MFVTCAQEYYFTTSYIILLGIRTPTSDDRVEITGKVAAELFFHFRL